MQKTASRVPRTPSQYGGVAAVTHGAPAPDLCLPWQAALDVCLAQLGHSHCSCVLPHRRCLPAVWLPLLLLLLLLGWC